MFCAIRVTIYLFLGHVKNYSGIFKHWGNSEKDVQIIIFVGNRQYIISPSNAKKF